MNDVPRKRGRGPGKKPPMVGTSLRLPKDVLEYYRQEFGSHMQVQMRAILVTFAQDMQNLLVSQPDAVPDAQQLQPEQESK